MKDGYIVANLTNYGSGIEIFGVYKSEAKAKKQLRKVIRTRYGSCPRDLSCLEIDEDDSYQVIYFEENNGD